MTMLTVGDQFPQFQMKAVVSNDMNNAFVDVNEKSYSDQWLVVFFWPKDFTFVCPTEIQAFGNLNEEFKDRDTQVLGVSTDSEFVHLAWRQQKEELNDLPFPMLSDINRQLSKALGVLDEAEGVAKRATFIIDPQGMIRFSMVTDMSVGRNPDEVLRVLDALQTDELCPCNWQQGQETINPLETESEVEA
ncbi:peroxiredoxin [bacterium SCSIO 12844]|nr:peroxiredoxin [bacterium SCSIO 12844]